MYAQPVVFVVDEDAATGQAIAQLGEPWGLSVRYYRSAEEFLRRGQPASPCCLIASAHLPDMSGLELQRRLVEQNVPLPVIMIGDRADVPLAVRSMRQGAMTFLVKPLQTVELREHIHEALQLDVSRRQKNEARAALTRKLASLTPRERQVMHQLVSGRNTKQIADSLGISTTTVDKHRWKVLEKMEVECIVSLVNLLGQASAPPSPVGPPLPSNAPLMGAPMMGAPMGQMGLMGQMSPPTTPVNAPVGRANVPAMEYSVQTPALV